MLRSENWHNWRRKFKDFIKEVRIMDRRSKRLFWTTEINSTVEAYFALMPNQMDNQTVFHTQDIVYTVAPMIDLPYEKVRENIRKAKRIYDVTMDRIAG